MRRYLHGYEQPWRPGQVAGQPPPGRRCAAGAARWPAVALVIALTVIAGGAVYAAVAAAIAVAR